MDVATAGVIDRLLRKLGKLLEDEYNLQTGVMKDVESLSRDLTSIEAALCKVAEVPRDQLGMLVRLWADNVRELSYNMEDVVDSLLVRVEGSTKPAANPDSFRGLMKKMRNLFKKATKRRQITDVIKHLKEQVQEVAARRDRNKVDDAGPNLAATTTVDPRILPVFKDQRELVGIEEPRDELIKRLTDGDDGVSNSKQQLKILSIYGFGGLGKTTLAKVVYNKLQAEFALKAFVPVGQNPDPKKVLMDILRQLDRDSYSNATMLDEMQLIKELQGVLENKRYLIVVDDIWDMEVWDKISSAFIGHSNGSAVLTTSRITDVARAAGGVYKLAPLSKINSRKLFYQTLFGSGDNCPCEFAELCEKIIEECSGMPLAIINVASLLKSKPQEDWYAAHDHSNYVEDLDDIKTILALSYHNLPLYLKPCLLYLSMFEKGCEISVDRLVWGWIAERFVPEEDGMSLRETGERYLSELINRNLMVPVGFGAGGGMALSCRVCNIVHDLIISLSAEENFATILDGRDGNPLPPLDIPVRRLSIHLPPEYYLPLQVRLSHLRSLVVYGDTDGNYLTSSLSEFQDLRVLDLGGSSSGDSLQNDHLKGIASLFRLRCLVVRGNSITDIPKLETRNLLFLQILDLRATSVKELPESIVQATQLKCLRVNMHTKIPDGIAKMAGLEELGDINVCKPGLLQELRHLTKLKVLVVAIWTWDESYDDALLEYLRFLFVEKRNIRSLSILTCCCSLHFLDKLDAKWAPPGLQMLEIRHSAFLALPRWICSIQNISSLSIEVYKLPQGIIDILAKLENLLHLCLTSKHAPEPDGRFTDGFRNLTSFSFLSNAMGKIFGPGAMLKLTSLKLSFDASQTEDVSPGFDFGLDNLPSLEHVSVKIICFRATRRQVKDAEAAICRAIHTANLEIQRVREQDMEEEEEDDMAEEQELQIVEDIKSPDEYNQSLGSANNSIKVPPEPCVRPNADETDEVSLLTRLMIDNMYLRLQLLNHDSKVKDMLRDIRLQDAQIVQAAKDRVADLMKQVMNIGYGPSDKSGIVEHKWQLHTGEENSTTGERVRGPAGRESASMFDKPNPKGPHMENHHTQNTSKENMCTEKDNQTMAQIDSSKISDVLVHIEDVCIPKEIMEILTKEFPHDGSEKYLDDKLINASIYCLQHKYPRDTRDEGNVFLEKTEICQLLHRDGKHAMSKAAIEKGENMKTAINYLNHDMIFLPLNWEQHWYLAVVSVKQHEIQVLDSMASRNTEREELKLTLKGIETYLELATDEEPTRTNSWSDYKVTTWKIRMVEGLPKQEDGSSCGLFMLKYIEYWTGARLSMSFTQDDINQFRRVLASMLVNSPLNKINNNKETEGLHGHRDC